MCEAERGIWRLWVLVLWLCHTGFRAPVVLWATTAEVSPKGGTFWGPLKNAKEEELWAAPVRCVLLWVIFVFILTLRYPTGRSRLVWW